MAYADVMRDLRRAYDAKAGAREVMRDEPWKQAERERVRDRLRAGGATTVLEIGAGHGVSGRYLADEGFKVTCVDLSPELVARCRAQGLTAHVMDVAALELPAASFDAGFGMNCLLHVPRADLDRVLRSVRRVLRPGGTLYWGQYCRADAFEGVYDGDTYEPKRFFSFLTDQEIRDAAGRVFDLVDFRRIALGPDGWGYQALVLTR